MSLIGIAANRNQNIETAEEYEVPVSTLIAMAPSQRAKNVYQDASQPYETPVSSLSNNKQSTDNAYHILESPSKVKCNAMSCALTIPLLKCM